MKSPLPTLLALGFATLSFPAGALAADTWSDPFPGIRYLDRSTNNWRIDAVVVDLCAQGVTLRATKSSEKGRVTSSFGQLVDAEVAVNGDFFSAGYNPTGAAIGDGENWSDDPNTHGWVGFGPGGTTISGPLVGPQPAGWVEDAVGGNIMVVTDGNVTNDQGTFCTTRHPRTAAGLTADERTLILAVVDGRQAASVGMTCTELGNLMKELGAHDAINLDGGGSTTMWMRGSGVVNSPSDGSQRTVANHLAVLAKGSGEPEACNRYEAEIDAQFLGLDDFYSDGSSDGVPDVLVGDEFQGILSLTSRTPRRWRGTRIDYWFEDPYLSATSYVIESDHPVYDQATWVVNSADSAPENPAKSMMGATGTLEMHAFTLDETKRVLLDLRADQYSIGEVDHPDARVWLRHIDGTYGEQTGFFEEPTNGNAFGEMLRAYAQLDVLSPFEWQFEDDGAEGWRVCDSEDSPAVDEGAMLSTGCVESPPWSEIPYEHLVVSFSSSFSGEVTIAVGDALLDFDVDGDVAVLDLSDAVSDGTDRFGIRSDEPLGVDGIWFQSAGGESSSAGASVDVVATPPKRAAENPDPIDETPPDGDDPDDPDVPEGEDRGSEDGAGASDGGEPDRIAAEGGCCATTGNRPIPSLWLVVVAAFAVMLRRRRHNRAKRD